MHFEVAGTAIRWCGVVVIVCVSKWWFATFTKKLLRKREARSTKNLHTHTYVPMHIRVNFANRGSYGLSWQSVQIRTANTLAPITPRNFRQTAVFLLLLSVMLRILRILFCMLFLSRWRCFIFVNVYSVLLFSVSLGGSLCTVPTTSTTTSHTN